MTQIRVAQIFGWFCLVSGAALVAWGWFNLDQGRASRKWPTVDGTIEFSRVASQRSVQGSQTTIRYHPKIRYSYEVDGVSYTGDRVSFRDDHFGKRAPAQEISTRYRPGGTATVYYSPDDPGQAVLEPEYDWSTYIPPTIGLLFFLTAAGILSGVRLQLQKQKPHQPH